MGQGFEYVLYWAPGVFYLAVLVSGLILLLESSRPGKSKMVRITGLVRAFALAGFCVGVLISGLFIYMDWRGKEAGPVLVGILQLLFPTTAWVVDYEGGKVGAYFLLFVSSIANGCWYGLIGLLVQYTVETWRKHSVRGRV